MLSWKQATIKPSNVLFVMPGFYGSVAWITTLVLYSLRLVSWNAPSVLSLSLFWVCGLSYFLSACCMYGLYRAWLLRTRQLAAGAGAGECPPSVRAVLLVLHLVGFCGLGLYVYEFSAALGGPARFFLLLIDQSHVIRWQAQYTDTIGTQLSYAGWIAAAGTSLLYAAGKLPLRWLALPLAQVVGNSLYIDRTRPVWIIFVSAVVVVPLMGPLPLRRALKILLVGALAGTILFLAVGVWVGKISEYAVVDGKSSLSPSLQNLYMYATGGFAYLDDLIARGSFKFWGIGHTAYPLARILALLKLGPVPASQVLDFRSVPYEFNYGTALEPFYSDGGILGLIVGIVLITLGADLAALLCWRANTVFGWFAAANICFASAMSFTTPKLSSFPLWLFVGFALLGSAIPGAKVLVQRNRARKLRNRDIPAGDGWNNRSQLCDPGGK